MNELSATAEGVTEKINEVLAKGDKERQSVSSTNKARRQSQLEEGDERCRVVVLLKRYCAISTQAI